MCLIKPISRIGPQFSWPLVEYFTSKHKWIQVTMDTENLQQIKILKVLVVNS